MHTWSSFLPSSLNASGSVHILASCSENADRLNNTKGTLPDVDGLIRLKWSIWHKFWEDGVSVCVCAVCLSECVSEHIRCLLYSPSLQSAIWAKSSLVQLPPSTGHHAVSKMSTVHSMSRYRRVRFRSAGHICWCTSSWSLVCHGQTVWSRLVFFVFLLFCFVLWKPSQ